MIKLENFKVLCPDHYPMKCNLSPADKDYLMTAEKYKAFFIFQYRDQDRWLQPTLEKYFRERTWRLFNAGKEGGTGTKFCNICRYALASDFGIASLTPLNHNVFQEIGLMQGLQKPLLYLLNPNQKRKLPFDIDDQIYVEHTDASSLERGFDNKISLILKKVTLLSGFESSQRNLVQKKVDELSDGARNLLQHLILEGNLKLPQIDFNKFIVEKLRYKQDFLSELRKSRFIVNEEVSGGSKTINYSMTNETYRKHLEEILWQ